MTWVVESHPQGIKDIVKSYHIEQHCVPINIPIDAFLFDTYFKCQSIATLNVLYTAATVLLKKIMRTLFAATRVILKIGRIEICIRYHSLSLIWAYDAIVRRPLYKLLSCSRCCARCIDVKLLKYYFTVLQICYREGCNYGTVKPLI